MARSFDVACRRALVRSVETDRVLRHRRFCLLSVEAFLQNGVPAVLERPVPLERSCRAGSFGLIRPGWIGFRGVGGVWQLGQGRVEPARSRTGRAVADGRSTSVSVRLERIDVALVRGSTGGWRCLEAVRWSWSGPKSRHRKTFKSWEHSGPSAAALGSRSVDGLDRNGPFYSGTPLKERIDGPVESLSRLNGHVAAAVGVSGSVAWGRGSCRGDDAFGGDAG